METLPPAGLVLEWVCDLRFCETFGGMVNIVPTNLVSMWKGQEPSGPALIAIGSAVAVAKRQAWVIAVCAALTLLIGIAYLATTRPVYEASASMLMDGTPVVTGDSSQSLVNVLSNDATMSSQIELLQSQKIAQLVVDELDLQNNPEFMKVARSPLNQIRQAVLWALSLAGVESDDPESPLYPGDDVLQFESAEKAREVATERLRDNLLVTRIPLTFVMDIKFRSESPVLAADIVNSAANSYLKHQLASSVQASMDASNWLAERVEEARRQSEAAGLAVERYRRENNLVSAGGTLIGEDQLREINLQLINARAAVDQAEAAYDNAVAILDGGNPETISAAMTGVDPARNLLARYDDARERRASIIDRLGAEHEQVVRLDEEIDQLERQLSAEYSRLVASYRTTLELARANEEELQARLNQVVKQNSEANVSIVTLQGLERSAQTYRDLHQNLLVRQQEVLQRGSYPTIRAQVINEAIIPSEPVAPSPTSTIIVSLLFGIALGSALGYLRETMDKSIRNGRQFADITAMPFAGYFPAFNRSAPYSPQAHDEDYLGYVQNYPQSLAASTIRNIRVAAELTKTKSGGQTIAVTSSLKGEGKTTLAINLARMLADSGYSVLVVDLDVWNPSLTRSLQLGTRVTLQDVIEGKDTIEAAIKSDRSSKAEVVKAANQTKDYEKFFGSKDLQVYIDQFRTRYDYVVLDFPPLGIVSDTHLLIRFSDVVIFCARWGATSRLVVKQVVETARQAGANFVCGALTMADPQKIKKFEEPDWETKQHQYTTYAQPKDVAQGKHPVPTSR